MIRVELSLILVLCFSLFTYREEVRVLEKSYISGVDGKYLIYRQSVEEDCMEEPPDPRFKLKILDLSNFKE